MFQSDFVVCAAIDSAEIAAILGLQRTGDLISHNEFGEVVESVCSSPVPRSEICRLATSGPRSSRQLFSGLL